MKVLFHGLRFDLPSAWSDVTDDLPEGTPPTLAREDGVGAIQFSIARFVGGVGPSVTADHLHGLLTEFFSRNSWKMGNVEEWSGATTKVGSTALSTDDLVAAWYVSDGRDIALVTYTASVAHSGATGELEHARELVRTIEF